MFDQSSAIADLQARWHTLKDPDRATAILPIIRSGVSRRNLATALNCGESLIRRLLLMLNASPEDLEWARRGEISSNEVVRRSRANIAQLEARSQNAERRRNEEAAEQFYREILICTAEDPARAGNAEQIIAEARQKLMWAECCGQLPRGTAPVGMPLAEIIRRSRPEPRPDELDVNFNAAWLAIWICYRAVNWSVRWTALDLALSKVNSRFWMRDL